MSGKREWTKERPTNGKPFWRLMKLKGRPYETLQRLPLGTADEMVGALRDGEIILACDIEYEWFLQVEEFDTRTPQVWQLPPVPDRYAKFWPSEPECGHDELLKVLAVMVLDMKSGHTDNGLMNVLQDKVRPFSDLVKQRAEITERNRYTKKDCES